MTADPTAKNEILGRLRAALADDPTPAPLHRSYRRTSTRPHAEVVEQLVDRLIDYRATVHRATPESLPGTIAELLADVSHVVPAGLDPAWLPAAVGSRHVEPPVGRSGGLTVRELDGVGAVITNSTVSCSETGTIFLSGRPDEGRRAISLVPDHHICIVPLDTIVELIPEALARLTPTHPITMISGPSATSDIELERVEGVHGPRRLDVILLASA